MTYCSVADVLARAPEFANDTNSGVVAGGVLDQTAIQACIDEQAAMVRATLRPRFDVDAIELLPDTPPVLKYLNAIYAAIQLYLQEGPQNAERNDMRARQLREQASAYECEIVKGYLRAFDGSAIQPVLSPSISVNQDTLGVDTVYLYGNRGYRPGCGCTPYGGYLSA